MQQRLIFLISLLTFLTISTGAYAADAGKILFVYGKAQLERNGKTQAATRGLSVKAGDLITTFNASSLQIRLSDNSLVALRPNTVWNLKEYLYDKANPSLGKQSSEIIKGGLRAVTGILGKANPEKITYTAGTTTIGIRGTSFEVIRNPKSNFDIFVKVETGAVEVKNPLGSLRLYPNETARVQLNKAPEEFVGTSPFVPVTDEINQQKNDLTYNQDQTTKTDEQAEIADESLDEQALLKQTQEKVADNLRRLTYTETSQPLPILSYAKFAEFLQEQGFTAGDDKSLHKDKLVLNSQTNDFFQSKGKFNQRGYKELKAAFEKLKYADKLEYAANPKDAKKHPLKFLEDAQNFEILQIKPESASSPEFEFARVKSATGISFGSSEHLIDKFDTDKSIYLKKGNNYHKYSLEKFRPGEARIYNFAVAFFNAKDVKFKTKKADYGSYTTIKIDFRDSNRPKILDASLSYYIDQSYKTLGSGMSGSRKVNLEFKFSGVNPNSYLSPTGNIFIDFTKIQVGEYGSLNDSDIQKGKAFLSGNLYNSERPNYLDAVFYAEIELNDKLKNIQLMGNLRTNDEIEALGDKIKHIGYVKFNKNSAQLNP